MKISAIIPYVFGGLVLAACSQAPAPSDNQADAKPTTAQTAPPSLEEAVRGYWGAIGTKDWYKAYAVEIFENKDGSAAEVLEPEYHSAMNKRWSKLKSYEVFDIKEDTENATGKARVKTLKPTKFKAPVDLETIFTDRWVLRDGAWRHMNPPVDEKRDPLQAFLAPPSAGEGESIPEEDRVQKRFIPGPGVRSNIGEVMKPPASEESAESQAPAPAAESAEAPQPASQPAAMQ